MYYASKCNLLTIRQRSLLNVQQFGLSRAVPGAKTCFSGSGNIFLKSQFHFKVRRVRAGEGEGHTFYRREHPAPTTQYLLVVYHRSGSSNSCQAIHRR